MTSLPARILKWTCLVLFSLMFAFSAVMKFTPLAPGSAEEAMTRDLGFLDFRMELGILQLVVLALFLIPRTSTVGFVLMVGYMAGILATNLTHGYPFAAVAPIYVALALLTVIGFLRNPELTARLFKRPVSF